MKLIHRYIFRELAKVFFISATFITSILLLEQILYMSEMIANRGVKFLEGVTILLYICPAFLILSIPLGVLVAAVTVFNQLSGDNEYVAMKTSGWSFLFLMRPVFIFSLFAYLLANLVVFYLIPWGNHQFRKTIFDIIQTRAHINIKPKVFNKEFNDLVLYAQNKEGKTRLRNIFVADESEDGSSKIILAREGIILSDPETFKIKLQFQDGTIHDITRKGKNYNILNFDLYERYLELPSTEKIKDRLIVRHRDISFQELREKIKRKKARGENTASDEVRLSKKFSLPFACLLFGFAGATLGIKSSRSGKSGGIIISGVVLGLYYISMVFAQHMGNHALVNPLLSVWIPNFVLLVFTVYMVWKTKNERPFTLLNNMIDAAILAYEFLQTRLKKAYKKRFSTIRAEPKTSFTLRKKKATPTGTTGKFSNTVHET